MQYFHPENVEVSKNPVEYIIIERKKTSQELKKEIERLEKISTLKEKIEKYFTVLGN